MELIRREFNWLKEAIDIVLKLVNDSELFLKLTIKDILWGYEDNLLKEIRKIAKAAGKDIDDHFGLFYNVSIDTRVKKKVIMSNVERSAHNCFFFYKQFFFFCLLKKV